MKNLLAYLASGISVTADELGIPDVKGGGAEVNSIMAVVYFWLGVVAVIVIIIGGLLYVTSTGDAAKVKRAKDTILYAVVGLVIVVFAFVITEFVLGRF